MLSSEYIAGFFDGEGSATIVLDANDSPYGFRWFPLILFAQKNPFVLHQIRDALGYGKVFKMGKTELHQLRISRQKDIRAFLDVFLPLVFVKRPQMLLVEQALAILRGQGHAVSKEDALLMLDIVDKLRPIQLRRTPYKVNTAELRTRIIETGLGRNFIAPQPNHHPIQCKQCHITFYVDLNSPLKFCKQACYFEWRRANRKNN